jgi:hypothetical protein
VDIDHSVTNTTTPMVLRRYDLSRFERKEEVTKGLEGGAAKGADSHPSQQPSPAAVLRDAVVRSLSAVAPAAYIWP